MQGIHKDQTNFSGEELQGRYLMVVKISCLMKVSLYPCIKLSSLYCTYRYVVVLLETKLTMAHCVSRSVRASAAGAYNSVCITFIIFANNSRAMFKFCINLFYSLACPGSC